MNKIIFISIALLIFFFIGCSDKNSKSEKDNKAISIETAGNVSSNANIIKKYPIKSGIITFEKKGISDTKKEIVYFDEYGIKERHEIYNFDSKIEEIRFSDGEKMYIINNKYNKDNIAYIMGSGRNGTEMKFIPEPFNTDKDKIKYGYTKLADMEVLDKSCEAYVTKSAMGEVTFAGWNNILLYSKAKLSFGESVLQAVKFEENANVDAALFKVPDGYEIKNM